MVQTLHSNIWCQPLRLHRYSNYERGSGGDKSAYLDGLRRYVQTPALVVLILQSVCA